MEKPITPEERLLKLIKEGAKAARPDSDDNPKDKSAPITAAAGTDAPEVAVPRPRQGAQAGERPSAAAGFDIKALFTVDGLNRFLTFIFALVFIIVVVNAARLLAPSSETRRPDFIDTESADASAVKPLGEKVKAQGQAPVRQLSEYTSSVKSRPLFKSVMIEAGGGEGPGPAGVKLQEAAQTLSVKGIIAGEQPQAVIEDTKTQKSYFVKEGEKLSQDIIVDRITDKKVRLKMADDYYELTL